jgi:hypothetical protein
VVQDARISQELGERRAGQGTQWPSSGEGDGRFIAGLSFSLAEHQLTWKDGEGERPWTTEDVKLTESEKSGKWRDLMNENGMRWVSQTQHDSGDPIPWERIPGWSVWRPTPEENSRALVRGCSPEEMRALSLGASDVRKQAKWWAQAPETQPHRGGLGLGAWVVQVEIDPNPHAQKGRYAPGWGRVGKISSWGPGRDELEVEVDFRSGHWNPANPGKQAKGFWRWTEKISQRPSAGAPDEWDQWNSVAQGERVPLIS